MKLYIGNINSQINCGDIITQLSHHDIPTSHGHMDLPSDNPFYNDSILQMTTLKNAGYDDSTVEYRHYTGGVHFDNDISSIFGEFVNATPLMCWISEIRPGKCTPWHWDINPWEEDHKTLGEIVRYVCFLSAPAPGHVFVTEDDAYYMEEMGAVYQYADIHAWHAGTNIGLIPKFLLTFTGFKKVQ